MHPCLIQLGDLIVAKEKGSKCLNSDRLLALTFSSEIIPHEDSFLIFRFVYWDNYSFILFWSVFILLIYNIWMEISLENGKTVNST